MDVMLTPAQRRGLEALASAPKGVARYSNRTRLRSPTNEATVYWQTADWLIKQGWAIDPGGTAFFEGWAIDPGGTAFFERLELTDEGAAQCERLGIVVAA